MPIMGFQVDDPWTESDQRNVESLGHKNSKLADFGANSNPEIQEAGRTNSKVQQLFDFEKLTKTN